ncbi:cysteine desulfurase family protein [Microbacterium sp. YY-01]|uniref:cysteine desulfurase family protein n=1 Tax=Microbacterium sp. YY-01 TaxID=3421634 RepID=UPI003D16A111
MSVYLDHAATTTLRPHAAQAWLETAQYTANASSTHRSGQHQRRILEEAREKIAAHLDCEPIEVIFTSGGTESINLALTGLSNSTAPIIVMPDGEHRATIDTVAALAARGATVRQVPLTPSGAIDTAAFSRALPDATVATAVIANNEVGTINDAAVLSAAAAEHGVPLHFDAVGAVGVVPLSFRALRGDAAAATGLVAMSIAGHKLGAPVGTGALVAARTAKISALMHGGGQQRGLRPGTSDVAGAVALSVALDEAMREQEAEGARLRSLRDELIAGVMRAVPSARLLGDAHERLPGNAHFLFPDAPSESLLFLLDLADISASAGSACQAGVAEPSHVVTAMGYSDAQARSVVRFTLGHTSTRGDVEALVAAIGPAYSQASGALRRQQT